MRSAKSIYPMLGTGAFFVLFLIGYALSHRLGLHPLTGLVIGLINGWAGIGLVVRLERADPEA